MFQVRHLPFQHMEGQEEVKLDGTGVDDGNSMSHLERRQDATGSTRHLLNDIR